MKEKRQFVFVAAVLLVLSLSLAGCASYSNGNANAAPSSVNVSAEDLNTDWNEKNATTIKLSEDSISINGSGAGENDGTIFIGQAGTYVVSGTLKDGQIIINAPIQALVRIVLNDVDITSSTTAPISCLQAGKLVVILADGTENTLTDAEDYGLGEEGNEPNAALFSANDLTINGMGSLTVNAFHNNGIGTKDHLVIVSGSITVAAANNAVRGRDSVTILDGTFHLTAGNDGIQSNNDTKEEKGFIELYGGDYTITSDHDGIQAETDLTIHGGTYSITTGGGSENAEERAEELFGGMGGAFPRGSSTEEDALALPEGMELPEGMDFSNMERPDDSGFPSNMEDIEGMEVPSKGSFEEFTQQQMPNAPTEEANGGIAPGTDEAEDGDTATASTSFKGLKARSSITITGGTFTINSADDGVHSDGSIHVSGGDFTIQTGDDGMHADGSLTIEGSPKIDITECYEGIEAAFVNIKGGTINIVASDDGINAAGGSEGKTDGGMFGPDFFTSGDYLILIEDGVLFIVAGNDGLDSNGDIEITGGTIFVEMSSVTPIDGDGIIDRDGTLTITGGTIYGAGSNGITVIGHEVDGESTQAVLEVYYSETLSAGTLVELKDAGGNTLASFSAAYSFTTVLFSTQELQEGETYTLYTNGEETICVTLNSAITSITDTGEEKASSGMGGFGGGMPGRQHTGEDENEGGTGTPNGNESKGEGQRKNGENERTEAPPGSA